MSRNTERPTTAIGRAPSGEFRILPIDRVRFGPSSIAELGTQVERLGASRALIVTGKTLARQTNLVQRVREALGKYCVGVFSETQQHVPRSTVVEATTAARDARADVLISFGGSSVIDTTKLVALALAAGVETEDSLDAYHFRSTPDGRVFPELPAIEVPQIAISTTLSAGEYTPWGGATDVRRGVKHAYGTPAMTPRMVYLDPEVTAATPRWLWGTTGLKAFDHAVETVCSTRPIPFATALARGAIEILTDELVRSAANPEDLRSRGLCQIAAWMSMFSLPSVASGLSHALGHQLGARCGVPHGVTSCILLPAVMDFNRPANAAAQRVVADAMGIDTSRMDDDTAAAAASDRLREITGELDVKVRLRDWNVSDEDIVAICEDAMEDFMALTNPRKLESVEEAVDLLRALY